MSENISKKINEIERKKPGMTKNISLILLTLIFSSKF